MLENWLSPVTCLVWKGCSVILVIGDTSHCVTMRSAMKVVCLLYVIALCRGHMFNMDLIEPPENPGPGMTYQKVIKKNCLQSPGSQ